MGDPLVQGRVGADGQGEEVVAVQRGRRRGIQAQLEVDAWPGDLEDDGDERAIGPAVI